MYNFAAIGVAQPFFDGLASFFGQLAIIATDVLDLFFIEFFQIQ